MQPEILVHQTGLVNVIGHSGGAILFGLFLWLLIKDRHGSRLSLIAAALALVWDLFSLLVLFFPDAPRPATAVLAAAGLSALSWLPSVLLDICFRGQPLWLVRAGYAVSSAATVLHWLPGYHPYALWLLTLGFTLLTAAGYLLSPAAAAGRSNRLIASSALFLLALSFAHLAQWPSDYDWRIELLIHHASIPLALYLLLQDVRFLLLDALVRVCANVALAAALASTAMSLPPGQPLWIGCTVLLLAFAWLRLRVESLLLSLLFPRRQREESLAALKHLSGVAENEAAYLEGAHQILARHMHATAVPGDTLSGAAASGAAASGAAVSGDAAATTPANKVPATVMTRGVEFSRLPEPAVIATREAEVAVPLRYTNGSHEILLLSRRQGGRRYLSEDLRDLALLAAAIVERVEQFRATEMRRLVAQAELQALEAQIHPHFLFNALNTLYGVIPRQAAQARQLVLNLADILRYFLQADRTFIPIEEEIRIVEAYLEIEALRLGARLTSEIDIDPRVRREPIPILSIEPLVENAVKHGIASRSEPGHVRVSARLEAGVIVIRVEDSGRGFQESAGKSQGAGVGLDNVRRRLQLCYGDSTVLQISSSRAGTTVGFGVPVAQFAEAVR